MSFDLFYAPGDRLALYQILAGSCQHSGAFTCKIIRHSCGYVQFSHMPEIYLDLCLQLSLSVLSLSGLEHSASGSHQTQHYTVLSRIK